jgi:hypothetical protein
MAMQDEQKQKTTSMFHAINKLASTSDSVDKELSILQEALDVALSALKDNPKALSDVAKIVIEELGDDIDDISYLGCESEIDLLNEITHLAK